MQFGYEYFYKKEVDKSLLKEGISIPLSFQPRFQKDDINYIRRGEKRDITIIIDGIEFKALLINQRFDETKYPNHKDILQIRYTKASGIPDYLRSVFRNSKLLLENQCFNYNNELKNKEYLALYTTLNSNILVAETISISDIDEVNKWVSGYTEINIENILDSVDITANMVEERKIVKIRKLDREIGNALKKHYSYKCQICGEDIGEKYNINIAHTHHIEYFSTSLNNDSSNIMIVCPNHHNVIHIANPRFDKERILFLYNNGYIEKLKINDHL